MIFEFLIAYCKEEGTEIAQVLIEALDKVLLDNLNEFDPEAVVGMIQLRHQRTGQDLADETGNISRHMLIGFTLNLPEDTEQIQTVVKEFSAALFETPPIFHAVKFEDRLLFADLAQYAEGIFTLEMKLRRVLTLIYLHAMQDPDAAYDLLRDESVQPMAKEKPKPEQMKAASENQFFHLTFGQYIGLNKRPKIELPTLLSAIRDADTYDAFRAEIDRSPIEQEDDAVLVAGLKERMEAIEAMRNCVAHNRRPTRSVIENYDTARPELDRMLDEYLSRWERLNTDALPDVRGEETPRDISAI